jgi:drug/metabolite transporter (DMT)-like permease
VAGLFEPSARQFAWSQVTVASALAWWYLVVMGTLVTLNAYLWLLKNTSAALAGSYSFVNPVVALAVGVVWAGETLTGWVYLAMPLILLAIGFILYGHQLVTWAQRGYEWLQMKWASRRCLGNLWRLGATK